MNIDENVLKSERDILKKDFDNLSHKIVQIEKDLGTMKSNLNALFGAIQQVDKLINLSKGDKKLPPEKEKALNLATS
jgi:uncharacterized coiled-coil DUF342 family protein